MKNRKFLKSMLAAVFALCIFLGTLPTAYANVAPYNGGPNLRVIPHSANPEINLTPVEDEDDDTTHGKLVFPDIDFHPYVTQDNDPDDSTDTYENTYENNYGDNGENTYQYSGGNTASNGVLNFTVVLHLEGWDDANNKRRFEAHADQLREYAELFEKYGAVMTLESKEIIDGCIRWDDNVLYEMQQRGHAVGIHADAGGSKGATQESITKTLADMKSKLQSLGISTSFASGVASKADWVTAVKNAGLEAVTCMVDYGLWSLDPALRPDSFEPYATPATGHGAYPEELTDRIHPWLAEDGSNWINHDPNGNVVILPHGLSLNNAYEELVLNKTTVSPQFTQDDIDAWKDALPKVVAAADPDKVNTFYAVWSFGQNLDIKLLEEWLKTIDAYVKEGKIRWTGVPDMIDLYKASLS